MHPGSQRQPASRPPSRKGLWEAMPVSRGAWEAGRLPTGRYMGTLVRRAHSTAVTVPFIPTSSLLLTDEETEAQDKQGTGTRPEAKDS